MPTQSPSLSQRSPIPPTAMPLVAPSALLQAHLQSSPSIRPSGRSLSQSRQIDLNVGSLTHCSGSSVVRIGQTTIICGVRGEVLATSEIPSYKTEMEGGNTKSSQTETGTKTTANKSSSSYTSRKPNYDPIALYNLVVPNIDLSTGCSPAHAMNTAPTSSTQALTQRLFSLLLSTHLLSSANLEIKYTPPAETNYELDPDDPAYVADAGIEQVKAFWVLYVDMVCISYGGEGVAFDAAWLAMLAALQDTLLPRAWWDGDEKMVFCDPDVSHGRRLTLNGMPIPLSFAVFESEKMATAQDKETHSSSSSRAWWLLTDPDAFEEESCHERGCVVVDAKAEKKILKIEKIGGGMLDDMLQIKDLVDLARTRGNEWISVLDKALKIARS